MTSSTGSPAAATAGPTRRERARAATLAEIKSTALELMRESGTTDVRFSDIARVMGLTPPALYRYYADRDELLTEMITAGNHERPAARAAAAEGLEQADAGTLLLQVARAYRRWALDDRQRFALIFGLPVPGYAAPEDGPTVEAAQRAMANLAVVVHRAAQDGVLGAPLITTVDPETVAAVEEDKRKAGAVGRDLPPATHQAMLHAWAALHGFVCLEAYGHLDWFGQDARDGLFRRQVELAGLGLGIPAPGADPLPGH